MANIIIPKAWQIRGLRPTEESDYYNRREILKRLGIATGGLMAAPLLNACGPTGKKETAEAPMETVEVRGNSFSFEGIEQYFPAERNEKYTLDRPLTAEEVATTHNNFYEFITPGDPDIYNVHEHVDQFDTSEWQIEVTGLAAKTGKHDLEDLIKRFGQEERLYRFRCVERWSMAVPWTGFPLSQLVKYLEPTSDAKYVRFYSAARLDQMPGVKNQDWYPWPYTEGLRMDEAMNELPMCVTGIYGKVLPKQHGAPIRIIVPWKYGYKNPKSIVKIEFTDQEPDTFWNTIRPEEYPFLSNVDPEVPHPRWSQAVEKMIPDGEERPTLKYNGYGEMVARLYM
ncbi:MAG: protein-methionine-sulfoxide reductase catalytic subunit MsrP [Bacteroidota bacterium]